MSGTKRLQSLQRCSVLVSKDGGCHDEVAPKRVFQKSVFGEDSKFSFRTKERLSALAQLAKEKEKRPHYSELNGGKIEALVADDDPINQVFFIVSM